MISLSNNLITRVLISALMALPAYLFLFMIRGYSVDTITVYGYVQYSLVVFLCILLLFETHQWKSRLLERKVSWKDKFKLRLLLELLIIFIFTPLLTTAAYGVLYLWIWKMPLWIPSIILYAGLGIFISTIFMGFVNANVVIDYWKLSLIRAENLEKESIKAHLSSLQSQLSPHFLFNNFNIIDALIEDDPKLARKYTQKLSEIFRYILEMKDSEVVQLEQELAFIHDYLFLLNIRFNNNIKAVINIDENGVGKFIPPAALQLLLENAIRHNEVSSSSPLSIEIFTADSFLIVKNAKKAKKRTFESTGIGLNNLSERFKLLSNQSIIIDDDADSFTVKIPLISVTH